MNKRSLFLMFAVAISINQILAQKITDNQVVTIVDSLPQTVGGVTVDAMGYVYVADFESTVWRVNPFTAASEVYADGFYGASGNAFDQKGNLYQSNFFGQYISKVSAQRQVEVLADSLLSGPVGIAVGADGSLYVCNCNNRSIAKVNPDGSTAIFATSALMYCPNGLAFGPNGDLFVVSYHNNNIVKITPEGAVSLFTKTPDKTGNGHIVIANNEMYVTGFHGQRVYRVSMDGEVSILAGTGERGQLDGKASDALFSYPNGIAISPDNKTLYINDMVTAQLNDPALKPSKSSLRAIKLTRTIDLIKAELEAKGSRSALKLYEQMKGSANLKKNMTQQEVNGLAYNYMMWGKHEESAALFQISLDLHGDWFLTYAFMGRNSYIADQPKIALKYLKKALELNPKLTSVLPIIEELEGLNAR